MVTTQTEQLLKAWVPVGYRVLRETAGRYGAFVTSSDLAARVQADSGRSGGARPTWVGQLLELVAMQAVRTGDAPLASLCVQSDLTVGDRYRRVLAVSGVAVGAADDVELRAAQDRLECYRRYADDLPEDGGSPRPLARASRPTRSGSTRSTPAKRAPERPAPAVCPTCFMQLPATGVCDTCG